MKKAPIHAPCYLEPEEVKAILAQPDRSMIEGQRDQAPTIPARASRRRSMFCPRSDAQARAAGAGDRRVAIAPEQSGGAGMTLRPGGPQR